MKLKSLIPLLIYAVEFTYAQVAFTFSYLGDMIVIPSDSSRRSSYE